MKYSRRKFLDNLRPRLIFCCKCVRHFFPHTDLLKTITRRSCMCFTHSSVLVVDGDDSVGRAIVQGQRFFIFTQIRSFLPSLCLVVSQFFFFMSPVLNAICHYFIFFKNITYVTFSFTTKRHVMSATFVNSS